MFAFKNSLKQLSLKQNLTKFLNKSSFSTVTSLKDRLDQLVPEKREDIKNIMQKYGEKNIKMK